MTVEATGFAATQARVSELQSMLAGTQARNASGSAFAAKLANAQAATPTSGVATADSPFVYDPALGPGHVQFKAGAQAALAALPTTGVSATGAVDSVSAVPGVAGTSADALVAAAKKYLGVPYKWGGTNPAVGMDCSGFVQRAFKDIGVSLPRVARDQQKVGREIPSLAQAKPGDLVTFGDPAHHIGIYLGGGKMIHAPRTGEVIKIADVYRTPSSIRRVLPEEASVSAAARGAAAPGVAAFGPSAGGRVVAQAPARYQGLFLQAQARYGVSADFLAAVARAESDFRPVLTSSAGARGMMQLMPDEIRKYGVTNANDPAQSVMASAQIFRDHLKRYGGNVPLALAAYNAGPGAVRKYGGVPPYRETQNYVRKITANLGIA